MIAANLAHLVPYLTGGSSNTDPNKSLGGPISATRVLSQSATRASATITGLTLVDGAGNNEGTGTLSFTYNASGNHTLAWTPPGGSTGTPVTVAADGDYAIQGANNGGILYITVVHASLPGQTLTNQVVVAHLANRIFDDVTKTEANTGDIEYRCVAYKNVHDDEQMIDLKFFRSKDTDGQDVIVLGVDPAGTGVAASAVGAAVNISAATWSGGVATITATAHGIVTGKAVKITSVDPSGYNGTYPTATRLSDNQFTVPITGDPGSYVSGGTVQIYDEAAAPSGVSFDASAISELTALAAATPLAAGESVKLWIRRTVPAGTSVKTPANHSRIGYVVKI